jgi:hypothetical protein
LEEEFTQGRTKNIEEASRGGCQLLGRRPELCRLEQQGYRLGRTSQTAPF